MSRSLMEMAAEIVQGQVSGTSMSSEEIVSSLRSVFGALMTMKQAETGDMNLDQAAQAGATPSRTDPKDSIPDDAVVCLECGSKFKQLTAKHLQSHDLSPREYKKKWGFPIVSCSVSRTRTSQRRRGRVTRNICSGN